MQFLTSYALTWRVDTEKENTKYKNTKTKATHFSTGPTTSSRHSDECLYGMYVCIFLRSRWPGQTV